MNTHSITRLDQESVPLVCRK